MRKLPEYLTIWENVPLKVKSSRTSLASRTHFEVLGLEASSPWPWPRSLQVLENDPSSVENSTIFWFVKNGLSSWPFFASPEISRRICDFCAKIFFFLRILARCVLGPWPWPRALLSLASRESVSESLCLSLSSHFFCVLALASSIVFSTLPLRTTKKNPQIENP